MTIKNDDNDAIIICYPVKYGPAFAVSTKSTCESCGQEVWISDSTTADVKKHNADAVLKPCCVECYKITETNGEFMTPGENSINEIVQGTGLPQEQIEEKINALREHINQIKNVKNN